jgi:hypothetical protein
MREIADEVGATLMASHRAAGAGEHLGNSPTDTGPQQVHRPALTATGPPTGTDRNRSTDRHRQQWLHRPAPTAMAPRIGTDSNGSIGRPCDDGDGGVAGGAELKLRGHPTSRS